MISLSMATSLRLGLTTPSLCFQIRVFSHAWQVFDEMLESAFIHIF